MRFSTSAFAPACTSPNHCEADPLRLFPDASGGEAAVTRYRVFPGMELDYRDVHARACRELRDGSGERLEIHHCLEGRVEYRQNGRYFYLSPGDLAVARISSLPPDSRFPTGHYHGITVTIDPAAAPECLSCILSEVEVRPATLMEKLCPGGTVFTARSSRRVKHVFSELYAVPEDIRKGYLKVKLLELLLFLSTLSPEDGQTPHGCTAAQVTLAEQVKACLLAEPDRTLTLKSLSQQFNVSEAQIKSSFTGVYGMSPAAYARSQRMHGAAALLRETDRTVLDIACQFGSDNASKFARAFRDVIGVSPREYRAGAEYDSCAPQLGEKPVSLSDADVERRI